MKFVHLRKLLESYNFYYTVPTDKRELLFDFYILTSLPYPKDSNLQVNLDEAKTIILEESRKSLLSSVFFAICAESRHIIDQNTRDDVLLFFGDKSQSKNSSNETHTLDRLKIIKDAFNLVKIKLDDKTANKIIDIINLGTKSYVLNNIEKINPTETSDNYPHLHPNLVFTGMYKNIYDALVKIDKYTFYARQQTDDDRRNPENQKSKHIKNLVHTLFKFITGEFTPKNIHKNDPNFIKFMNVFLDQHKDKDGIDFKHSSYRKWDKPRFNQDVVSYQNAYKMFNKSLETSGLTRLDFVKIMQSAFVLLDWDVGFGGIPWSMICNGWLKLYEASISNPGDLSVWIDHVYDLQHNTDTVFNKLKSYYDEDVGHAWIIEALDKKRDSETLWDLYENASAQVGSFMPRVLYNATGTTLEMWMDTAKKTNISRFNTIKDKNVMNFTGPTVMSTLKEYKPKCLLFSENERIELTKIMVKELRKLPPPINQPSGIKNLYHFFLTEYQSINKLIDQIGKDFQMSAQKIKTPVDLYHNIWTAIYIEFTIKHNVFSFTMGYSPAQFNSVFGEYNIDVLPTEGIVAKITKFFIDNKILDIGDREYGKTFKPKPTKIDDVLNDLNVFKFQDFLNNLFKNTIIPFTQPYANNADDYQKQLTNDIIGWLKQWKHKIKEGTSEFTVIEFEEFLNKIVPENKLKPFDKDDVVDIINNYLENGSSK